MGGPRRKNESLFTPVRESNVQENRKRCFSSACDMLEVGSNSISDPSQESSDIFCPKINLKPSKEEGEPSTHFTFDFQSTKNPDLLDLNASGKIQILLLYDII